MYSPAHPGKLIQEYLNGLKEEGTAISLTQLASHIGITRTTLSRIVNGHQALTADIALRLHEALGVSPELLLKMQVARDIWENQQKPRSPIALMVAHA
jgi:addiction module HigA family antidote